MVAELKWFTVINAIKWEFDARRPILKSQHYGVTTKSGCIMIIDHTLFLPSGDLNKSLQDEEEKDTELMKYKQENEILKQQLMLAGRKL